MTFNIPTPSYHAIPLVIALVLGCSVCLSVLGLNSLGAFQDFELTFYDLLLSRRAVSAPPLDSRVTLVAVDEADIAKLQQWPFSDSTLAKALQQVLDLGPRAVGLDLYRDLPVPPGNEALTQLFSTRSEIIVIHKFGDATSPEVPAPKAIRAAEQIGCNDLIPDGNGVVRRGLLYFGAGDPPCYALGLRLALSYLAPKGITEAPDPAHPEMLRLGNTTLPPFEADDGAYIDADAQGYQFLLDYRRPVGTLPRYSLRDLFEGRADPADFAGKIVLLGIDAESVKDHFFTPRKTWYEANVRTAGVEIHGLIADQLLRAALDGDHPTTALPAAVEAAWVLFWCLLGIAVGLRDQPLWVFAALQSAGLLVDGLVVYGLFIDDLWLPIIPSALGWLLSTTFITAWEAHEEKAQRQALMNLFARAVDPRIAEEIWRQRETLLSGGRLAPQKIVATVFFSDLVGFTSIAENMEPGVFVAWLNEYLDAMTGIINRHGGVVIRFIGDAILAGFGVPIPQNAEADIARNAANAVACALDIQKELARLNAVWQAKGQPVAAMRIGINTGQVVAASVGNLERSEYTIYGDAVNTASRLESYDKDSFQPDFLAAPCRILISDATSRYLAPGLTRTYVGSIAFKGKTQQTGVFSLS